MRRPSFAALILHYPADPDPLAVKKAIGGNVDAEWITNTCVVRVSAALNKAGAGHAIPNEEAGLVTVRGADNKRYALRVAEFADFMRRRYGEPDLALYGTDIDEARFKGLRGIICWQVSGWSDATGHFTLWDDDHGAYVGSHDYFGMDKMAREDEPYLEGVEFWQCDP